MTVLPLHQLKARRSADRRRRLQAVRAIEFQGGGHFSATAARDAVKKEALRRAGIGYEEILAGHHTPAELRRVVEKLVQRAV